HNTGSDYFFENIVGGQSADQFVAADRANAMKSIVTLPLIGWVPRGDAPANHPFQCGFKVSRYGAQQSTDPYDSDCGNRVAPSGSNISGNDPTDTSMAIQPSWDRSWVKHLVSRFGTAASGGVQFYDLDNEPVLWQFTHRDVHPQGLTYDELFSRSRQYAAAA